jgi:hypothetical protein
VGDVLEVKVPAGNLKLEILSISRSWKLLSLEQAM